MDANENTNGIGELIAGALAAGTEERRWEFVKQLHCLGTEDVLNAAAKLLESPSETHRILGADILGQLGPSDSAVRGGCQPILVNALEQEQSGDVVGTIGIALYHIAIPENDEHIDPILARYANHPSAEARLGITMALGGHNTQAALDALLRLAHDQDRDVRDWAVFALGSLSEADNEAIRAVLRARVSDPDAETRAEALMGLAVRKEPGAAAAIREELGKGDPVILLIEAAGETGAPILYDALVADRALLAPGDDGTYRKELDEAIEKCKPK